MLLNTLAGRDVVPELLASVPDRALRTEFLALALALELATLDLAPAPDLSVSAKGAISSTGLNGVMGVDGVYVCWCEDACETERMLSPSLTSSSASSNWFISEFLVRALGAEAVTAMGCDCSCCCCCCCCQAIEFLS